MYELVLFDFDCTLADTSKGIIESVKYAFEKMGYPAPDDAQIKGTIGKPLENTFFELSASSDKEKCKMFRELFMFYSKKQMCENTVIFTDTVGTLEAVKKAGLKTAVVSAKDKPSIEKISRHYGFLQYIDAVIGEYEVSRQKPDPEQVEIAMSLFCVPAEKILYVGDSLIDARTAANAKVDFLAVTTGATTQQMFEQVPKIGVIPKLGDVLNYLPCV